jgi:hypothetical protein
MADVKADIAAYDAVRPEMEEKHMGKWVIFHNQKLVSVHDSFDDAAKEAVRLFGRGPYLIRQVGASSISLPASVMFGMTHA